jgi:hypothetical protein
MPRPKGSATVRVSEEQLESLCGEGSLVCVPKAWLKSLGFDPDQKKSARVLGVHTDGKEVWDYLDWAKEEARLRKWLTSTTRWTNKIKRQLEMLETGGAFTDEYEKANIEQFCKSRGLTTEGYKKDPKAVIGHLKESIKGSQKRIRWYKERLKSVE